MVGDQCEVVVLAFPADLVDPDLKEVLQPVRVELVGADPADDPPDGVPVDPDQAGDRGLVHRSRQPSDQLLEVAGEPRPVPRERHRFHSHAMLGALKPSELGAELEAPDAEIEMPPARLDRLLVVAVARGELAQRALEPPSPQRHRHDHPIGVKLNLPHPDPVEIEQARECPTGAHVVLPL